MPIDWRLVKVKFLLANRRRIAYLEVRSRKTFKFVNFYKAYPKTWMENSSKGTFLQLPPRYCLHHVCAFFLKSKEISFEMLAMRMKKRNLFSHQGFSRAKTKHAQTVARSDRTNFALRAVTLHYPPLLGSNCLNTMLRASAGCSFSFSLFQNGGYLRAWVLQIHPLPSPSPI